ncbi:hypothetical protein [Kitasatospora sp. LaBMicrA B282]|uniref:hypothetical protein n=1 Tax=Kitasatospora sp. LaBMicrA B282 TaxID=3420949 RepID=UPI003D0DBFAA
MTRSQHWDLGGTLSGRPSLHTLALAATPEPSSDRSGRPPHRGPLRKAPQPSGRANRSKDAAARIAAAATRMVTAAPPDRSVLSVLDRQLRRIVWRDHARPLEAALETLLDQQPPSGDLPHRLHHLGRWFAVHGEHPNAVRLGMLLLGLTGSGTPDDTAVLTTLGTFWAFSSDACAALVRSLADPQRPLFELARQAEGWARVDAVGRLGAVTDPEIREWLVRASCTGDVLDNYFALHAARVGGLAAVLAREALDAETLGGAGRLLEALTDLDGPGPALSSYDEAVPALDGYLRHATTHGLTLQRLWSLLTIHRYLHASTLCQDHPEWRRVRRRYADLVAGPAARDLVLAGLADEDPGTLRRAAWAARRMDLPARPALLRRVEVDPHDNTVWFLLVDDCPPTEIAAVVAAAERLLPLQRLRTGPTTALGLGAEYEADRSLDLIVSRLGAYPGHGWPLIEAALGNRTSRNRRMALRALAGWPVEAMPAAARQVLLAAAAREPVPELRAELTRAAERLVPIPPAGREP